MQVVADELDIHPVEVYGVVTFYAFLRQEPKGRFVIRLCRTISCDMAGQGPGRAPAGERPGHRLRPDHAPTASSRSSGPTASGMCDQGPALLVNDQVFTAVTPEKVHEILEECRTHLRRARGPAGEARGGHHG